MKVITGNNVIAAIYGKREYVKNKLRTVYVILLLLMDLPSPRWQDHVAQKWIQLETEQREQFISFEEIDDVFNYVRTLIT